ncbi:MAG: hypothetical protein HBSAPP04_12820 [Ignavibacteriaceae bacterium]|nr:MAG: hypothetical protein EDM75_00695 [Chlorobiota bacterium]GJQ32443.1 MAG: hypothetical protein HBSAPP04_12820 [Ignavibacteriaceae bacterium]
MNAVLDLLGATVISAFVTLMLMNVNNNLSVTASEQYMNTNTQQNMVALSDMLHFDLKNTGYRVTDSIKIVRAESERITVRGDFDNNGVVDSVKYYLGQTSELSNTPNPNDKPLYRVLNAATPVASNWGVTSMKFSYYDSLGNETTYRSKIRSFKIKLQIMSAFQYDGKYTYSSWEKLYKPRNLR